MLIMLTVSALIGGIAAVFLNGIWGTIVGLGVFVAWFQFNRYHSTTGLFKANLNSYFMFRRSGHSVDQALLSMVEARYRFSEDRRRHVTERVAHIVAERMDEEETVVAAVETVFLYERGILPNPLNDKYRNQIRPLYRSMRNDQA